ncbi:MAG: hypothetical protein JXR07_10805 [Reichenbachiella sp.]
MEKINIKRVILFVPILFFAFNAYTQKKLLLNEPFKQSSNNYDVIGKGDCYVYENKLVSREAYASLGNPEWQNYRFSFEAKVPSSEEQVQIWASFREQGRNERYIVGLKGGLQNDIEIGRMGLMGDDAFLGIRNLDFQPTLGQWYTVTIEVCKNRIRVFLNDDEKPRIDVIDERADLLPAGKVAVGGSWIKTEFRNLKVAELPEDYLDDVPVDEYSYYKTKEEKEKRRRTSRKAYKPHVVTDINPSRTEISLDGNWLFKPGHEITEDVDPKASGAEDDNWHVMDVPNFWNPSRIWLHGETFMDQQFPKGVSDTYYQKETDRCENYTFDYKKTKVGWYRQYVELPESINGKHLELSFEAVSKVAEVYVNGSKAGSNIGMFGAFNVDITDMVTPGENVIAVKVLRDFVEDIKDANEIATIAVTVEVTNQMLKDLPHGFFRGNPAGIWQPVKLVITEPIKIVDVYIKPNLTGADFEVTIKNKSDKKTTFYLNTNITDEKNGESLLTKSKKIKLGLEAGEEKVFTHAISDIQPKLWSPEDPNLYNFTFAIQSVKGNELVDSKIISSGFRTFETRGDYFYLNGNRYWLRGANHTPHALGINDVSLAEKTFQLYHDGNIAVTRSHTIPYSKVWMDAADKKGVGVSFEGTWPWLMIGIGENSIPDQKLLDVWKNEWLGLLKKYRNHPSLFYWTINNEMNFTHHKDDVALLEPKMKIVSDVVKQMREVDPTRPICFDSGYTRKQIANKTDSSFFEKFDDGDIEDGHNYSGWYHSSIFDNFIEASFTHVKTKGRPLISQEWSTGYPNTETGHHTRSYLWQHQNTQTHVGNHAYPFGNPKYSLENNAFLTSELVEAIRRSYGQMAGMHNFSSITWFRNVYDAKRVEPYPTYYRMQNSLNPVLVSAELWGRHFYTDFERTLPTRFCIVNDQVNGEELGVTDLKWEITYQDNRVINTGSYKIPPVKHYGRHWITPEITLTENFTSNRLNGKLRLFLSLDGKEIATNEYNLVIAKKEWVDTKNLKNKKIILVDFDGQTKPVLDFLGLQTNIEVGIASALSQKADIVIFSGINSQEISEKEVQLINQKMKSGAHIVLLNTGKIAPDIFPEYVSGYLEKPNETAQVDIPESRVFDGIEHMDLRYFNNEKSEKPLVFTGLLQVHKKSGVESLSSACQHRYARIKDRRKEMLAMKGFPIISIEDGGKVVLSEMMTEKGIYDPIAAKLLINILNEVD